MGGRGRRSDRLLKKLATDATSFARLQVNVLATGLLGVLLLPLLQSTSRLPPLDSDSSINSSPRLTITGSGGKASIYSMILS